MNSLMASLRQFEKVRPSPCDLHHATFTTRPSPLMALLRLCSMIIFSNTHWWMGQGCMRVCDRIGLLQEKAQLMAQLHEIQEHQVSARTLMRQH